MRSRLQKMFKNRKTLYLVLIITLVFVFTLTVAYAALNTILKINGNAEVVASSWDIHLDNVQVRNGSVGGVAPKITSSTTATFSTKLTTPGDFYEFTIDVVNNGSIDAMIDSIEKTPTLTENQSKYLNYIVEYQNGESINTKQLVEANSFVRLKVKVEFRKDIVYTDLPSTKETLNLSFKVNYVQADEVGTSNVMNDGKLIKVVSGDYDTVGSEICIGSECFYVISSTDDTVTMLAKYNLLVGNKYDDTNGSVPLENTTGLQNASAIGWFYGFSVDNPIIAVNSFSDINYWSGTVDSYPSYVYNENSYLYEYVEDYKSYLRGLGVSVDEARLISMDELEKLGCVMNESCSSAPSWVWSSTYWTGVADSDNDVWRVITFGTFYAFSHTNEYYGVRPVITIPKSEF